MTLQTRRDRIKTFYCLLRDLPEGPDRDAEIAHRSGITELDFKAMVKADELADQRSDAMVEQQLEQQSAWRWEVIAWLSRWDDIPAAERQAFIVLMRDFFQRLAAEAEPKAVMSADELLAGLNRFVDASSRPEPSLD